VEYTIIALVAVINFAYVLEVWLARPDWTAVAYHSVVPRLSSESILIVVGIVGATVMPHNVYLHSALVQSRLPRSPQGGRDRRRVFLFGIVDTVVALNMAWLVNAAILIMSAAVFYRHGLPVASIEEAHQTLRPLLGGVSSLVFAVGLLASGLASSTTATLAGQVILGGFLDVRLSIWSRRLLTMLPALVVIGLGMDPLRILILSQVSLSLQLPFAVVPLILFTRRRDIMGEYVNRALTTALAAAAGVIIIGLNGLLLFQLLGGRF
jgi:manganese transport protein